MSRMSLADVLHNLNVMDVYKDAKLALVDNERGKWNCVTAACCDGCRVVSSDTIHHPYWFNIIA